MLSFFTSVSCWTNGVCSCWWRHVNLWRHCSEVVMVLGRKIDFFRSLVIKPFMPRATCAMKIINNILCVNYTPSFKKRATFIYFYFFNRSVKHFLILMMSLYYLVKCRLLNLLLASRVNTYRLHSCWKRTFWGHAVIKTRWYDTYDILKDNGLIVNRVCRFSVNRFWANACAIQYEFIALNGQTTTFAFHKVV